MFYQESFADIRRDDSKLRTYGLLKTEPGYEFYLSNIQSIKDRTALTKFRISNHVLQIEKGRHKNVDKRERFCPFCPEVVEDEEHFLLDCKTYRHLRTELFKDKANLYPQWESDTTRFTFLVNNCPISTSIFLRKSFDIRQYLLQKYKPND